MSRITQCLQNNSLSNSQVLTASLKTPFSSLKVGLKLAIPRALLMSIITTLATTVTISQAHAELVIHNQPSQQIRVTAQDDASAQLYRTQFIDSQIPSNSSVIKLMQVLHIDEKITTIINSQQSAIDVINSQTNKANQQSAGDKLNKRQRELQTKLQQILG